MHTVAPKRKTEREREEILVFDMVDAAFYFLFALLYYGPGSYLALLAW